MSYLVNAYGAPGALDFKRGAARRS